MSETYYRIQPADRDTALLLDPSTWTSRPWVGVVYKRCPACVGSGRVRDGEDFEGLPEYATCSTCHGFGETEDVRQGVSACRDLDDLQYYFRRREADLEACVIVEMEADLSVDDDWEARDRAVLVLPRRIIAVTPLTDPTSYRLADED